MEFDEILKNGLIEGQVRIGDCWDKMSVEIIQTKKLDALRCASRYVGQN